MSINNELDITTSRKIVKQLMQGKSVAEVFLDETLDSGISLEKIKELELIVKDEQPVVKFDIEDAGRASVLNYNVPNSTSYVGTNYIILEHPKLGKESQFEWFNERGVGGIPAPNENENSNEFILREYRTKHPSKAPLPDLNQENLRRRDLVEVLDKLAASSGVGSIRSGPPCRVFESLAVANGFPPLDGNNMNWGFTELYWEEEKYKDFSIAVHNKIIDGYRPFFIKTSAGTIIAGYLRGNEYHPRIMILETYSLTSFLGDYGAGKTVKTFTLLPNEKTKISVKTWKTTETNYKQASSILDSWTRDSSDSFEKTVTSENTNREELKESSEWHVEAEVSGGFRTPVWGVQAKVSGGTKGSSNSSREIFAKNVSNATQKQVANASSKRNVEVNTSFETKTVTGQEDLLERQLENVNAGRVLNFVFRQLHQEYITYLHLVNVRLAFTDGLSGTDAYHYREFTLDQIENFLDSYFKDEGQDEEGNNVNPRDVVRTMIVEELATIIDYKGKARQFIEAIEFSTGNVTNSVMDYLDVNQRLENNNKKLRLYLRVNTKPFYQIADPTKEDYERHMLDGIILAKNKYVLPSDSLIVEALLGQAEALDKYSIESRKAVIDSKRTEIEKMNIANSIIIEKDAQKAEIYAKVYPPTPIQPITPSSQILSPSSPNSMFHTSSSSPSSLPSSKSRKSIGR